MEQRVSPASCSRNPPDAAKRYRPSVLEDHYDSAACYGNETVT
jgi:hypothetical protein